MIDGERKLMTVNDVHSEYGVSEQAFIDVAFFLKDREITARGDTLEEAMSNLADAVTNHYQFELQCAEFRRQFDESINSCFAKFRTPIIGGK